MARTFQQVRRLTAQQTGLRWTYGTSDSGGSIAILRDAALSRYADWYWDGHHLFVTDGSPDYRELFIHDFLQTDGDVRFRPNEGTAPDERTYEILPFSPTDFLYAIQDSVLELYDVGLLSRDFWMPMVSGSPLYNSDFGYWTSSTQPDGWTINTSTASRERASANLALSETSLALTDSAGYAALNGQYKRYLQDMKGQSVTLYCWVLTSASSTARLALYDGSTVNYSSYHGGDGDWELLHVEVNTDASDSDLEPRLYIDTSTTAYFNMPFIQGDSIVRTYPFATSIMPDGPYEISETPLNINEDEIASGRGYAQVRQPAARAHYVTDYRVVKHHDEAATGQIGVLDVSLSRRPPRQGRLLWLRGDGPLTVPSSVTDTSSLEGTESESLLLATRAAINLLESKASGSPLSTRRAYGDRITQLHAQYGELAHGAGESRSVATYATGW